MTPTSKYRVKDKRRAAWHRGFDKGLRLGLSVGMLLGAGLPLALWALSRVLG